MNATNDNSPGFTTALYQAVWRWHFIVGLIVMPLLVMMAITGGLYLFKNEIDHYVYRDWQHVKPRDQALLPMSEVIERVEAHMDGRVLQLTPSTNANDTIKLIVRVRTGESRTTYVDSYDGQVIGSTEYGGVMQVIRKLHSLQRFGFWASCLIEITAGWTIVMMVMGIYLWWPRQRKGGVVSIRGRPTSRMFWRDVHAVVGAFTVLIILFLALTGMPWSMFWGDHVQAWAGARGLGQPPAPANVIPDWQIGQPVKPRSAANEHVHNALPWALEQTPTPNSVLSARQSIGVDHALHLVKQMGMLSFTLTLPVDQSGAYMATYRPDRTEDTRVLYLDQYTGAVLGDVGYAQYGPVSKVIEWGIAVHQGTEYGAVNRYLMLAGCVAIVLLAVSSIVMWLKRKPSGSLGVPQRPDSPRALRYVLISVAALGVVFPLVGVSLVVALLVEMVKAMIQSKFTLTRT